MGWQFLTSYLLPDLCIESTPAILTQEGNFPLNTDSLKSLANIDEIRSGTNLNATEGTSFNFDLFDSKDIIFSTSSESFCKGQS